MSGLNLYSVMSEELIPITYLNDFIFCPASIYFHNLEGDAEKMTYQSPDQLNGSAAHRLVDQASYASNQLLQGISVYSEQYSLYGKIDSFDIVTGVLRERKKKIKAIYDGQIFQVYAQCFSLREMGYEVKKLVL